MTINQSPFGWRRKTAKDSPSCPTANQTDDFQENLLVLPGAAPNITLRHRCDRLEHPLKLAAKRNLGRTAINR